MEAEVLTEVRRVVEEACVDLTGSSNLVLRLDRLALVLRAESK